MIVVPVCSLLSSVLFAEGAQGEADWDGEDGDGGRKRHQQTSTQHSLYWGKQTVWLICVNVTWMSSYLIEYQWDVFWLENPLACTPCSTGATQTGQVSLRWGRKSMFLFGCEWWWGNEAFLQKACSYATSPCDLMHSLPGEAFTSSLTMPSVQFKTKSTLSQNSVTEVRAVIESQFEELQAVVERAKREVTEILEGEEKQALRQAEGIRVHLEQRCTELKKTQAQMEKLSKNKNDVDFLQVTASGSACIFWTKSCIKGYANFFLFICLPLESQKRE